MIRTTPDRLPRTRVALLPMLLMLLSLGAPAQAEEAEAPARDPDTQLLLATTTSVRDSGLLDALLPEFRDRTGIAVQVVAVGTGAALRMGAEGNADVLITHAEDGERELVASGAAVARIPFMENDFVIAGPPEDPAGAKGVAGDPVEAYRRIARARAPYVSRGDDSGTHRRERELLAEAGIEGEKPWPAFASTGSGMGLTLQVAGERRAYVLSDIGTFLAYRDRVDLERLSARAPALLNVYAVLRVDPERFPGRVRADNARHFEAFLVDPATQRLIADFGRECFGEPLFRPLLLPKAAATEGDAPSAP
jgi:tungstate transport system substrate-binding protein